MNRVLIIGAGGVGRVTAFKCAMNQDVFHEIVLASRTKSKCDKIAADIKQQLGVSIMTDQVDADYAENVVKLIEKYKPQIVLNLALPYQDLAIMEGCLQTKTPYLDTANYEPKDVAKFEYKWQWAFDEKFKQAGLTAILGCGFDPGVTQVYTSYAQKHHFGVMEYLDIVDCNAGSHGKPFATNFNPEINIREITQKGKYWENGQWVEIEPMSIMKPLNYPEIGPKNSYILYHEELESLVKNYPSLKRARFWMTFGEQYLTYLRVIQDIGMSSIKPVKYKDFEVIPIEFLKEVLPKPDELGENYTGWTSIGNRIKGTDKEGKPLTYYIYNNCSHEVAYKETGTQAVAYTTGVPAMIGAMMYLKGLWKKPGVWNVEQFDPDPFMEQLNKQGLPWNEKFNVDLEI